MSAAYAIVKTFEDKISWYTNAPFAVAVDSCTNAIFLTLEYLKYIGQVKLGDVITIPSHTYVSVPCSIIHAGLKVRFENRKWKGIYRLKPLPVFDAAKRFRSNMYIPHTFMCLSFHGKKHLNIGEGGMILTDSEEAAKWLRVARFSGRHEVPLNEDTFEMVGWKMTMSPERAARGLMLMDFISDDNPDQEEDYPDLSVYDIYKR